MLIHSIYVQTLKCIECKFKLKILYNYLLLKIRFFKNRDYQRLGKNKNMKNIYFTYLIY
jgi:hypothetical protein